MYTEEQIIEECENKKLMFKRIEYIHLGNKKRRCVTYVCKDHMEYGEQNKPVEKLFSTRKPCVYCNHSRLDLTLQDEVRKISPNVLVIGKYINTDTLVKCKCIIHGETWESRPLELIKGKTGCSKCIANKKYIKRVKPLEQFKKEVQEVNSNIEFIGEYYNTHTLTDFRCLIHNIQFKSLPCNILNQTSTCPLCAKRNMQIKEGLSLSDLKKHIIDNNLQMEIVDPEYINYKTPIKCRCLLHNIVYDVQPRRFLYHGSTGCPKCFQSIGEKKLGEILSKMKYNPKPQYSFEDCKYKNKLRFDYYDKNENIAFEYQGEQHYYPVNFGGISDEEAKKNFEETTIRDGIKKQYCEKNNIKLICVPYWEYNDMEHFLMQNI